MGYCKQCGAYLPDGQSKCLACGFDEAAKTSYNKSTASAAASTAQSESGGARIDSELLRKQMEQQRAQQREQSRLWAEQEAARRKAKQESDAKRRAYEEQRTDTSTPDYEADYTEAKKQENSAATSRLLGILSYISALCFLPFIAAKGDKFAMYHARQGLKLFIFATIGNILGTFIGVGWIFTVAQIFFALKGIGNASNNKTEPLPFIGELFKF